MLRSALLILSGNAVSSLLLLARNLIVARLISVENFGIAATFAIAVSVVEMMSNLGLQQQIIQSDKGDDPQFQAALQGFSVLRGVLSGVLLLALAGPMANFLGIPQAAWAYQIMALVPVLNAFQHYDIYRLNRKMQFWPLILTNGLPALAAVLVLLPFSMWFGDYRIMLYSILAQSLLAVVTSHIVAMRPYRLVLDRRVMADSLSFGWPLLVNGLLLFTVFQGDKIIVGRELGMATLAIFAMGFTLTLTPTLVMAKSAQTFFLPQLSALTRQETATNRDFDALARAVIQAGMTNGVLLVLAILLLGPPLVTLLLGAKYAALLPLLIWLAILQAFRVFKSGSTVVALARRQTANAMTANLIRVITLPIAWIILIRGGDVMAVIMIGILGEMAGFAVSLALVGLRTKVDLRPAALSITTTVIFLGLVALSQVSASKFWETGLPGYTFPAAIGICTMLLIWSMKDLRNYIGHRITIGKAQ
ncbi:oligosaccharide flippase family protein [Profundibacter sp.]